MDGRLGRNPVGVGSSFYYVTQGSPAGGTTLGFETLSLWDKNFDGCCTNVPIHRRFTEGVEKPTYSEELGNISK